MAHNKLYRNFIILQGDDKIHASSAEKALSGYAKIEAKGDKCRVSFYVQNLDKDEDYNIVLICYKENKQMVDLGSLKVNELGKGEVCKEYYINNIAGLDLSFDKISGAALCKGKDENTKFLMYGFINGEVVKEDWKKLKMIKHDEANETILEKKIEPIHEEKKEHKKKECDEKMHYEGKKSEHHENHKHDEDHECKHNAEEKHEEKHEEEKHEEKKSNNEKAECKKCMKSKYEEIDFESYEKEIKKQKEKEIDPYNFELKGAIGEFFCDIVKDFEECKHKYKEIKFCKWYKAKVDSLNDMCCTEDYNKYVIAYYPMLNYYPYIKRYGYFMIGYKCNEKGELEYIVYGVPGKKDVEEQPYGGKTGFVTWMSTESDEMGSWLMFYDYKKSIVVVPSK